MLQNHPKNLIRILDSATGALVSHFFGRDPVLHELMVDPDLFLEASAMTASSLSNSVADLAQELEMNRAADLWDE